MMRQTFSGAKIRSIKFNVLMNMLLTSSSLIFPLITVPYVSRILSTFGTGIVAFGQSVLSYFSLVALLGISSYGVRACAQVRDDARKLSQTVKELLIILCFSTSFVFVGYLLAVYFVPKFSEQKELFLIFGVGIWLASFGVEWLYQALEQYGYITVRNVVVKILCVVAMFFFVQTRSDYIRYGTIVVVAGYGSNVVNILRLRKLVDFSIKTPIEIGRHFKPMFSFFVATAASGMYVQSDLLMLGFLGTTNMVGLYQLVVKIKGAFLTAVNSVGNVMLPRLSYYNAQNENQKIGSLIAKTLNFSLVISLGVISGCYLGQNAIIMILGGPDFMAAHTALVIISPAIALSAINSTLGNYMASNSMEKTWAILNTIGFVVSLVLTVSLIPIFGIVGAALSSVLCELFVLITRIWQNYKFLFEIRKQLEIFKILSCAVVAAAISKGIESILSFGVISNFMVVVFVFLIIYVLFLMVAKEYFASSILHFMKVERAKCAHTRM